MRDRFVFVCAHTARDARCASLGPALLQSIRQHTASGLPGGGRLYAYGCSHIGGHKYAPNAVVYPSGDWFGHIAPEHAPHWIDTELLPAVSRASIPARDNQQLPWEWRGRIGLTEAEQQQLQATASAAS